MSDKNIYQRINAVMSKCDYLQKKQAQQGKGIKYDEVMAMIRQLLIDEGVVMVIRQVEMESLPLVEGTKQRVYQGKYEMDLVNMDDPTQVVTHSSYAHGMDGGDKGPGKAHTYAVKQMLVKGFGIETGEDEESRAEKMDLTTINTDQQATLYNLLCDENGYFNEKGAQISKAFKFSNLQDIKSSKYDAILKVATK